MKYKLFFLAMLYFSATNCYSWSIFEPKTYEECILENMKGINGDVAAQLVARSCKTKFEENNKLNSLKHKWTKVAVHMDEESTLYIDNTTIEKHGKVNTATVMIDMDKVQIGSEGDQYSSLIIKIEMECNKPATRYLNTEYKSGHMGLGNTTGVSNVLGKDIQKEKSFKESKIYKAVCIDKP